MREFKKGLFFKEETEEEKLRLAKAFGKSVESTICKELGLNGWESKNRGLVHFVISIKDFTAGEDIK